MILSRDKCYSQPLYATGVVLSYTQNKKHNLHSFLFFFQAKKLTSWTAFTLAQRQEGGFRGWTGKAVCKSQSGNFCGNRYVLDSGEMMQAKAVLRQQRKLC